MKADRGPADRNEYEKHLFDLIYAEVDLAAHSRAVDPKRIWHVVDLAFLDGVAILAKVMNEREADAILEAREVDDDHGS